MPFSYDIEQRNSSRLKRHALRVNSDDRIEVKALGQNLGQLARSAQVFDPNAYDGDGDGLVQDSTPFERPAVLSNIASIARGLASATGGYGSYTPRGSWTVGLTNEEVAERAVPSTPAAFVEMLIAQGSTGTLSDSVQKALDIAIFDEERVAELRDTLRRTLDERPALRASFDRFGVPPIGVHPSKDENGEGIGYGGIAYGKQAIFITEQALDKTALQEWFGRRKFSAKVFSFTTFAPRVKGVDRAFTGEAAEDVITHEWGHYLNFLVSEIAPEVELRDLALALTSDNWYLSSYFTRISPEVRGMFDYFNKALLGGEKVDQPDGVPFVKSVYGTSSPVEFFAESVAAYFSPSRRNRELLNDEAVEIVEQMLGIQQVSRGGFASRTGGMKSGTGSTLRGKTPQEIADTVVPKTKAEAIALADAHNALLTDPGGKPFIASEPDTLKSITPNGIDAMDFSPEAVSRMKEMVVEALSNNPNFYEAVQRFGMPPVMITKPGERLPDGSYAISGVEGFPAITIDSTVREKALVDGFPNGMYPDEPFIKGTTDFLAEPTSEGFFIHEWAHFLNRLALDVHPDEEMKALARFWWNDTWELDEYLPKIAKLLRKFIKPEDRVSERYSYAQKFGKAAKSHKSVDFTGYPHVKTQYGQSMPAETFAEAVTVLLSNNVDEKKMVSPELRKDVLDILGFTPSVKEVEKAGSSEGRREGFASKKVRKAMGTRIIDKSDPFTPLSGSDWLKDATDEEIADAVVPTSLEDAVALTIMNAAYGADPSQYPAETARITHLMQNHIFTAFGVDNTGKPILDGNGDAIFKFDIPLDFSPEGIEKTKKMLKRMMAESPEFAWMIRRFGCPPIMMMDETKLVELQKQVADLRAAGLDVHLQDHLLSGGVGGFSVGALGITIRPKPDSDDLPMGFNNALTARRRTGRIITNPDGSTETEKEHWMNNFGMSLPDVGIHEWAHWFYSTVKGNKKLIGSSSMGDRKSRLAYLFPGMPEADAEKMSKEFMDAFDLTGFIPFNTMSMQHLGKIIQTAEQNIVRNVRGNPNQTLSLIRFNQLINDYIDKINKPPGWSPSIAKEFTDQIAIEFPYLVADLPPLINGTYATATRQELWAEAVLLFSSPDSKLKGKYLTPEIEAFIAYAFGLKPDRDPNTPYQKPWASRSGLSSSSRVRRLHAAQDSIPDRVSEKDDGFASRTAGESITTKMRRETSSTSRFTVGDYDFDITDEDLSTYDWDTAYDQWTTWSGNWRMRHLSSAMMGIEQQPTKGGEESLSTVHEIMRSGELLNAPDHVKDSVRESLINTHKTMEKISMGETVSDKPLYRGLGSVPDDSEILMASQGETITFPLSAFTPDRNLATTFADMNAESDKKVILQLQSGAHVASSDYTTQIRDLESDWIEVPIESVTQGEFTVVSKIEKNGYTVVELSHSKTFDPLAGRMVPTNIREGFASSSMRPERRVSDSAIRTLTDNMDFLRDNPPMGKGGKDLDDRWAEQTIEKLRNGEINQEEALDLMNAVIAILNNGFKEDPSQKDNPEGKLLAYQKLAKRLRKLAVGGMSKDDMDELRRERGIMPTVVNNPGPYRPPSGGFGFSSTTSREETSTRAQKRIDDIDSQLEELESSNERLSRAISELQATGNWEGEKHDVFLKEGNTPKTYSKEQLESNGWTQRVREESARASFDRQREIDALKRDRDSLEDSKKRLTGEYPETTTLVDELLLDEDNVESLMARSLAVDSMSQQQRIERFTDPNDPDVVYVIHFGASKLEGGQLDPSRSRGQVGPNAGMAGNTRLINDQTARHMVGLRNDARRDVSILEDIKRQMDADGIVDFDAIARTDPKDSMRAGRARLLLNINRGDPERSTHTPPYWSPENFDAQIEDRKNVVSRLDKVADQLIADDYQYTSTYRASKLEDLTGNYGGRYAEGDSTEWGDNAKPSPNTGIHIFRVRIGEDAVEQNSVGETHLVGKHTPIASLVVDSNASDGSPGREIWKGWVDSTIEQDIGKNNTRRSGFASRASIRESSRVIGEDGDASKPSILSRAKEKLKLNERQVGHLDSMTSKIHSIFTSGKIYDEPIHPAIDDRRKELLDSVRVVKAEGGMTMIIAEPNPIFNAYLPVKRDWASIELPPREAVAKAVEKLKSNSGDRRSNGGGVQKFIEHIESMLQEIGKLGEGPGSLPYEGGKGPYVSYVQQYYDSIRDPIGASQLLMGSDGLHDAFGHFGTGRGYDRHGEWANYLAMKDMIDASPLTDEEKEDAHRFWFREYGFLQFGKRGDLKGVDSELRLRADDYDGPFSDILDIIDSGHNGLDDAPTEDIPLGKTISEISIPELQLAAKNDVEERLDTGRSGFSSRTGVEESTKNQVVPDNERSAARKAKELIANGGSNEEIEAAITEAFTGVIVGRKDFIDNAGINRGNKFYLNIGTVSVTDTEDGRKRVMITGRVVSKYLGEYQAWANEDEGLGFFNRVMYFDENSAEVLHTDISVSRQGLGIATALNARNEEIYRELGISEISLYGNSGDGRNGATHWPRNGYSWYDEDQKNLFLDTLSEDVDDIFAGDIDDFDKKKRDEIKALIKKSRADKFGEGVTPAELLAWDDQGQALNNAEIRYRRDIKPSRSGFSSGTQLTPTDDVKEAKRSGRPLSVLRPGTMPPNTQAEYDRIINNLNNAKIEAQKLNEGYGKSREKKYEELFQVGGEHNNDADARLEKYKDLVRIMQKEYKKLGFKKKEIDAIVYAITAHLEAQHRGAAAGFIDSYYKLVSGKDEPWDDEARLQQTKKVLEKSDIVVTFPRGLLEKLIADGRFKTQFETGTSGGALHPEARAETDIVQFGYHPDTAPEMRPVYGYLTSGGTLDRKKIKSVRGYGNLHFVLKRDTHARSTYTTSDSLLAGATPSPMGVPSANASISPYIGAYSEAQIHGGLSLSDIDYVIVSVGAPDMVSGKVSEEEFESISGMLAKVGIRVVPVRDGEIVDTWNGGKIIPEPPADIIPELEPVKAVA